MLVCWSAGPPSSNKTVCKFYVRVVTLVILRIFTFDYTIIDYNNIDYTKSRDY